VICSFRVRRTSKLIDVATTGSLIWECGGAVASVFVRTLATRRSTKSCLKRWKRLDRRLPFYVHPIICHSISLMIDNAHWGNKDLTDQKEQGLRSRTELDACSFRAQQG
jgi:hypothetical protein